MNCMETTLEMRMKESSLSDNFGLVIEAGTGQSLCDIPGTAILEKIRSNGALLLRGFTGDLLRFEAFTQTVALRFIHNGNDDREALGDEGRTRSVTPGQAFVGPHSEFSYTPFRPDLLFFYCLRPASSGGASLLWDGRKIWQDMPASIKETFLNKQIVFKYSRVNVGFFGQFVNQASAEEVCRLLDAVPNLQYTLNGDALDIDYASRAFVDEGAGSPLSFSNSVAVLPETVFHDGSKLDPIAKGELLALALKNTVRIDTLPGDVIVIDNWRTMHGREAFEDSERKICIRMGYTQALPRGLAIENIEEVEY